MANQSWPVPHREDVFSLFVHPWAYRLMTGTRAVAWGIWAGGIFLAAAWWWEVRFNHARPAYVEVVSSSGWLRWWVDHGTILFVPAAIATVIFMIGLRIGGSLGKLEPTVAKLVRTAVLYLAAVLLAAVGLARSPGGLLACWLPFAVAIVFPWRWRRWRTKHNTRQARRPTLAGFRPPLRAVISFRGWVALENVDVAYPQTSLFTTNIADTTGDESAARFRRLGDHRSEAYCVSRAIEYMLIHNKIADAEARSRSAMADEFLGIQPAIMAVRAQFLVAVGQHADALTLFRKAERACKRPPAELQALILHGAIDSGRFPQSREWQWSEWRRARMVWRRQAAAVVLGLAADARLHAPRNLDNALKLAYQICRLPDRIILALPSADVGLADLERMQLAKGLALEAAAEIYAGSGRLLDACSAYLDAHHEFAHVKDRPRAGRSLVRSYATALTAGYTEPDQESHALDMVRVGLQVLEDDRGALRGEDSRASWITSQRELYATTFAKLSDVRYEHAKAGELGFWLLESLHRSLTTDLILAQGALDSDPRLSVALTDLAHREADSLLATVGTATSADAEPSLEQLREQVRSRLADVRESSLLAHATDAEAALQRLGDRVALLYHCWREEAGWVIHGVLVSGEHGIRVHRGLLAVSPTGEDMAPWLTPAGALDALDAAIPDATAWLFNTPLDDPVWNGIAADILPPSWRDVLCPATTTGPLELLVVPDGPIASLPMAALPVTAGRPLLEYASVALAPALSLLDAPGAPRSRPSVGTPTAVVHIDGDGSGLPSTAREAEGWRAAAQRMRVIQTASQAEIETALQSLPSPDIAVISVHGSTGAPGNQEASPGSHAAHIFGTAVHLRDGSVMSAAAALRLHWPPTVILGACWVSAVSIHAGREPFGFPLACLLRGASTVIGGVAPIPDAETATVLSHVINELPHRSDALSVLREAQMAALGHAPFGDLTPTQVAGLIGWTTAAARSPGSQPAWMLHWDVRSVPRSEVPVTGVLAADGMVGEATRRILRYAKFLAKDRPVGTLEFLDATISADSADWTGFTVACETGEPRLPGTVDEAALGTVTVDLGQNTVTVTMPLAKAMHRGQRAVVQLHDEVMLPQHVVLAALADDGSAAARWLRGHKTPAAANWLRHLSDRVFGTDISDPNALLGEESGSVPTPVHDQQMTGVTITDPKAVAAGGLKWRIPVLVAAVLLLLSGSTAFLFGLHKSLQGQGALGIVTAPAYRPGAAIVTILPGSSAQRAGLRIGDVIISVAGTPVDSVTAAGLAIRAHSPGAHVPVTVLRNGRRDTVPAVLGDPVSLNNPGYLGVTVANSPRGATVTAVAPGSPAAAAGLQAGDVITAVSGYADGGSALGMLLLIESHHPGQTVLLSVLRGTRATNDRATLGRLPQP